MIRKYATVSIIYGGSGKKYAEQLRNRIEYEAKANRFPISANIIMDSILSGSINDNLIQIFKSSDVCVAFLTADDLDQQGLYRIRQNVIYELGMAIMALGESNCLLLKDFDDNYPLDWPSDLVGLPKKTFSPNNFDNELSNIIDKVLRLCNGTEKYDYLLTRKDYGIDYNTVFDGYSFINQLDGQKLLEEILTQWADECQTLSQYDEKSLFILERIGFLPIFGYIRQAREFLESAQEAVRSYDIPDLKEYKANLLDYVRSTMHGVLTYSELKETKTDTVENLENLYMDFSEAKRPARGGVNPLVDVAFYDYFGLTALRLYRKNEDVSYLSSACECFKKALRNAAKIDSLGIWKGFLLFNLARVYEHQEKISDAQKAYKDAIRTRRNWLNCSGFRNTIRNALSYEYFIAKINYLKMCESHKLMSDLEIREEYKSLDRELTRYSEREGSIGRLFEIRKELLSRI